MTAPWAGMADLRFAIRTLWRTPVFALGAVLTLALGIGANVAVFTFVKGLLLQPLPYPEPDRLVAVEDLLPGYPGEGLPVSYLNFEDWQKRQRVFSAMAVYLDEPMVLTGSGDAERSFGARASAGLFRALGVAPASGRTFTDEEDRLGGPPVAVISHGLWQQRFGGQPAVGRTLLVDDVPRTIVGVMPAGFDFPDATALWIPAAVDPSNLPARPSLVLVPGQAARRRDAGCRPRGDARHRQVVGRRVPGRQRGSGRDAPGAARKPRALGCLARVLAADGHGGARAVDRLRQPREPDARTGGGARTGDGHPLRARRLQGPDHQPGADRERGAGRGRHVARAAGRRVGKGPSRGARAGGAAGLAPVRD